MSAVSVRRRVTEAAHDAGWWQSAVIYQVYPRSFADGNGDGVGDLAGLIARLPYIASLGVDGIWMTPFQPSPQVDQGYDVSDYCGVDPLFGTMDEFDRLLELAHSLGLRILLDVVPNHCSSAHPLFQQALAAGPGSPEREHVPLRRRPQFRPGLPQRPAAQQLAERLRRPGLEPRQPGVAQSPRTPSGTCTSSPPASPTGTGGTPPSATTSKACSASGSTRAWTASGSTSRMPCSRPTACRTRPPPPPWWTGCGPTRWSRTRRKSTRCTAAGAPSPRSTSRTACWWARSTWNRPAPPATPARTRCTRRSRSPS